MNTPSGPTPNAPTHCQACALPVAQWLNQTCACITLDEGLLAAQLEADPRLAGLTHRLQTSHPHLFSRSSVFLDEAQVEAIAHAVKTLDAVMALPAYAQRVLADAPAVAQPAFGPHGVFMGYDFHLTDAGPKLIEVNTNAGGGFLNAALAAAHRACCAAMQEWAPLAMPAQDTLLAFVEMFRQEWCLQPGDARLRTLPPLRTVAIVDDKPLQQYLAPEFELARWVLAQAGIEAVIVDPQDLYLRDGQLWCKGLPNDTPIDLVYNRLTDFYLAEPHHAVLRQAYLEGAVVLTPHPRAYALTAHKSNLIALQDKPWLAQLGLAPETMATLGACLPATQWLTPANSAALWAQRRQLFFKPATGYGSKAVYRGDKLTQRVWQEMLQSGGYLAQEMVPPSERLVMVDGQAQHLKVDVRAYAYQGQVQLLAARTYTGQTTNMRTPGGGFSPVLQVAR